MLKRRYADLVLEEAAMKDVISRKTASARRQVVQCMSQECYLPMRRACAVPGLSRAGYYPKATGGLARDAEVIEGLNAVVERNARSGCGSASSGCA